MSRLDVIVHFIGCQIVYPFSRGAEQLCHRKSMVAPVMYDSALIQFMYAMGFSPPAGMILAFVRPIIAGWKAVAIPLRKAKGD